MINPNLSNFHAEFGESFFPEAITKKYDDFLFQKNYPFKDLKSYLYETIQNVDMPGLNLATINVNGMQNLGANPNFGDFPNTTINRIYPGTAPENEIVDGTVVTITFRNTLLNWMYCYEVLYSYYKRTRNITDFGISLIMRDSAEIPMLKFSLSDCFISNMPGLSFSFNQSFSESKTFDIGFTFNKFVVSLLIPEFNLVKKNL